jgi:hypothetical protein
MDGETRIFGSPVFHLFFSTFFPPSAACQVAGCFAVACRWEKKTNPKNVENNQIALERARTVSFAPSVLFSKENNGYYRFVCVWMVRGAEQAASGVFLVPHDWDADEVGKMEMVSSPRSPLRTHILQ